MVGGATYTPTATATSGLAVTLTIDASSSSVCSLSAGKVSFTAFGTCIIDANQAGNATYAAAPQVQQSVSVGQGSQAIIFTSSAPGSAVVGGATYSPTATGGASGNPVVLTIDATTSAVCSITGGAVSFADRRHLHRRRQPGGQRQLHGGPAGPADLRGGQGLPDGGLHLDGPGFGRASAGPPTPRPPPEAPRANPVVDHR